MAKAEFITCDNPSCNKVGQAELIYPRKGNRRRGYVGPYGWIQADVYFVGSGPDLTIDVCSIDCLQPATTHAYEKYCEGFYD